MIKQWTAFAAGCAMLGGSFLSVATGAAAEDCGPLTSVASLTLTSSDQGELVPVEIAGVPKLMLLDTGAAFSTITERAAKELGLTMKPSPVQLFSVTGTSTTMMTIAPLSVGMLKTEQFNFQLDPTDNGGEGVGVLGADILSKVDVSFDFGAHHLDLMLQDHCDGRVKYWKEQPITVIPFKLAKYAGHIIVPVEIDGRRVNAILDTGASTSTIKRPFAEYRMGVDIGSPDTPEAGNLNGEEGATVWSHTFKTLTFDGVTVANPQFMIIPDRMSKHFENRELGSLINRPNESLEPEATLGLNVLKHLHVYIAYKEKKLYITPSAVEAPASK